MKLGVLRVTKKGAGLGTRLLKNNACHCYFSSTNIIGRCFFREHCIYMGRYSREQAYCNEFTTVIESGREVVGLISMRVHECL